MASEASRKKAEEIIGRCDIFMLTSHVAARGVAIDIIASALDEARAEGERIGEERAAATIRENVMSAKQAAELERWECHKIANATVSSGSGLGHTCWRTIASRIRSRGPMRGPEEDK